MSGLDILKKRLQYHGGNAEQRFQKDKLKTLRKALLYSYQAATAILSDGREFRCLINDDKLSTDYNNKILSIPYEDICLNSSKIGKTNQGYESTNIKTGDIFVWKETNTNWLIYLQYLEEDSYFRAKIIECNAEIDINGKLYKGYIRGPAETDISWREKINTAWSELNYSLIVYITKNDETLDYFHRFKKVKIDGNTWEVEAVNPYFGNGIIKVSLGEWYNNEMEDFQNKIIATPPTIDENSIYIEGNTIVKPYDIINYKIHNCFDGEWIISNKKAKIIKSEGSNVTIEIITGKSGRFNLIYKKNNIDMAILSIIIESL